MMHNPVLFLSQLDFVEVFSFRAVQFLWQLSILIIAAWGTCKVLKNESPRIKSAIWKIAIVMIPFLPLISGIMTANDTWDIYIDFDSGTFMGNDTSVLTEHVNVSEQETSSPSLTEKPITVSLIDPTKYKWAITFLVYCVGFLAIFSIFLAKILRVYRWRMKGHVITDFSIIENLLSLKNYFGISRTIKVFQCDEIRVPMVLGIFESAILLPSILFERFDEKTLKAVLAHECAHIARKDNLILLYASFVQTVLFFHPLVWFAVSQLSLSVEEAADSAVMDKTEIDAQNYASVLFGMAAITLAPVSALPFSRNHKLLTRIKNILRYTMATREKSTINRIIMYFLPLMMCGIFVFTLLVNINCGTQKTTPGTTQASLKPSEIYMTVYGKVVDPDGKPVAGVPVDAVREKPGPTSFNGTLTGDCRFMAITDSDGNFHISFPEKYYTGPGFNDDSIHKRVRSGFLCKWGIVLEAHAGNKWVQAPDHRWLPDLANGFSQPIKLTRGKVGPVIIRLTKEAIISGTVYDGENRPMPQHHVGISYHDGRSNRYFRPFATTDEEGRFTIKNVRPGKIWLTAIQPYSVFKESKSPFPENISIILNINENDRINGLALRGMTNKESSAIFYSLPLRERRKSVQVY